MRCTLIFAPIFMCSDVDDEDALLYGDSDISMAQQLQQSDPIQTPADINDM